MKILIFNCGSSTLKFQLIELDKGEMVVGQRQRLAYGSVDRIGTQGRIRFVVPGKEEYSQPVMIAENWQPLMVKRARRE